MLSQYFGLLPLMFLTSLRQRLLTVDLLKRAKGLTYVLNEVGERLAQLAEGVER